MFGMMVSEMEKELLADPVKAGAILGCIKGKQSRMRGASAKKAKEELSRTAYEKCLAECLKYSEETVNLDIKRYDIYCFMSNNGGELVDKITVESVRRMDILKRENIAKYEELILLIDNEFESEYEIKCYLDMHLSNESIFVNPGDLSETVKDMKETAKEAEQIDMRAITAGDLAKLKKLNKEQKLLVSGMKKLNVSIRKQIKNKSERIKRSEWIN